MAALLKTQTHSTPTPKQVMTDPATFARTFLYVLDKAGRLIKLRYNPVQHRYLTSRTRHDLVLKARQLGLSTAIQAEHFRKQTTGTAITMTLAHEDDTTQKLRRMADRFYDNLPQNFRPKRGANNDRLTTYPEFNSEAIIATAGNKNTGRGGTYTHFHGSEVAFWKDAEAIIAGAMQGGNPRVVLESSPNGAQGYFYQLCMEALDGNSQWRLHFFPWWLDPKYRIALEPGETVEYTDDEAALVARHHLCAEQIKWRRAKQRELKHLFIQEYPEDPLTCFLLSGFGYFGALSGVFVAPAHAEWDDTHRYVAGLDFAQTNDYTDLTIIDATVRLEVARLRINQLPWKEMRRQVIALCKAWHVSVIQAEANSMGSTNIEAMAVEMVEQECSASLVAFDTTNESKASIMGALHEGLHNGGLLLLDDPVHKHELMAFTARQLPSGAWQLSAPDKDHDDSVISLALSWDQVVNYRPSGGIY